LTVGTEGSEKGPENAEGLKKKSRVIRGLSLQHVQLVV